MGVKGSGFASLGIGFRVNRLRVFMVYRVCYLPARHAHTPSGYVRLFCQFIYCVRHPLPSPEHTPNLKFRVWGLGFRVWHTPNLKFRVWGLGFGVWGLGFGVWG